MVLNWGEKSNSQNIDKKTVLEGQEVKLINQQGIIKDYVVLIIDSEGVHLAEWDFGKNEPTGIMITVPPEDYDRTFGLSKNNT